MTATAIERPREGEFNPHHATYVAIVPSGDILSVLARQPEELRSMLGGMDARRAGHRYAPGKWSIREVIGHLADAERVFCYRGLTIARNDRTSLPPFDENAWVEQARFDSRTLSDLLTELASVRAATLDLFSHLSPQELARVGTASGKPLSARAVPYIIAGHTEHHIRILRDRYL
ncbi:MAG: DinB family protein [Gemmatimonadota bacterium]|nr:DinB family protein [Gemmatimonadota bacterium]